MFQFPLVVLPKYGAPVVNIDSGYDHRCTYPVMLRFNLALSPPPGPDLSGPTQTRCLFVNTASGERAAAQDASLTLDKVLVLDRINKHLIELIFLKVSQRSLLYE